jgi:hypothetical protein
MVQFKQVSKLFALDFDSNEAMLGWVKFKLKFKKIIILIIIIIIILIYLFTH